MKQDRTLSLVVFYLVAILHYFAYYGCRAIIIFYLISEIAEGGLGLDDSGAYSIYGTFGILVTLMSLPAGFFADLTKKHKEAVVLGGFLLSGGLFLIPLGGTGMFWLGLFFVAVGSGLVKVNLVTLTGWLYERKDKNRDIAILIFYFCINVGAFLAPLYISGIGESHGWKYGFWAAGGVMFFAPIIFLFGARNLDLKGLIKDENYQEAKVVYSIGWGEKRNSLIPNYMPTQWSPYLIVFLLTIIFWGLFELLGMPLNQITQSKTFSFSDFGIIEPIFFYSVNPIFVFVLTPLLGILWYLMKNISSWTKIGAGFVLFGLSFYFIIQLNSELSSENAFFAIMTMYFLHTLAELLIAPTAISYIQRISSVQWGATMIGLYFAFSSFIPHKIGSLIAGATMQDYQNGDVLMNIAAICLMIGVILVIGRKSLKKMAAAVD